MDQTQLGIVELDDTCAIVNTITSPIDPSDPEDLAVDKDGTLWVADTGNNQWDRPNIALHEVSLDGATNNVYRFVYPDGAVHDTEALLLGPDGVPIFVTKDPGAPVLYRPTAGLDQALDKDNPLPLEEIGTLAIAQTETSGGPEILGDAVSTLMTGGAVSADGSRVVLRTYTDAYEWAVVDGDIGATLIGDTEPTITPLPDEPQGEAIMYTADGTFVTASEAIIDDATGAVISNAGLWTYEPAALPPPASDDDEAAPAREKSLIDTLGINGILWVIAGVGFIGAIIFAIGLRVILKARKARKALAASEANSASMDDFDNRDGRDDRYDDRRRDEDRYREHGHDDRFLDEDRFSGDRYDDDRYDDRDHSGYRDDRRPRDDRYDDPDYDDRRGNPVPRQYADSDDGLGGGRLFEKPGNQDQRGEPAPGYGPENGGNVYGEPPRRHEDGTGTVYGGGGR
ncbi:hypothetical protein [Stackebrandtia soli]|uniref:hypothetical protein n=1 Tax=Stackebrandtia soli TaxID=1892856 RepID=UPI0039EA10D6